MWDRIAKNPPLYSKPLTVKKQAKNVFDYIDWGQLKAERRRWNRS